MRYAIDLVYIGEAVMKLSMVTMIGLYFIFSNTVMQSLRSMDNGADVMVKINQQILNPVFMATFIVSGISAIYFIFAGKGALIAGGIIFFIGTTLVTMIKNVPLNNALLATADALSRHEVWNKYLDKWVFWNHVRTVSALVSGFILVL